MPRGPSGSRSAAALSPGLGAACPQGPLPAASRQGRSILRAACERGGSRAAGSRTGIPPKPTRCSPAGVRGTWLCPAAWVGLTHRHPPHGDGTGTGTGTGRASASRSALPGQRRGGCCQPLRRGCLRSVAGSLPHASSMGGTPPPAPRLPPRTGPQGWGPTHSCFPLGSTGTDRRYGEVVGGRGEREDEGGCRAGGSLQPAQPGVPGNLDGRGGTSPARDPEPPHSMLQHRGALQLVLSPGKDVSLLPRHRGGDESQRWWHQPVVRAGLCWP